jgi:AraC-like DNA-binding protein
MKPVLAHYPVTGGDNFFAAIFKFPYNPTPLHYHPEFELLYVIQGTGTRFIGDSLGEFEKGEFCLLGPNLPHLFRNHKEYYAQKSKLKHESITIHFTTDAFGKDLIKLPQLAKVRSLLMNAQYGIDFNGHKNGQIIKKLFDITELHGLSKMLKLLEVLDEISHMKSYKLITANNIKGTDDVNGERLKNVIQYLLANFTEDITLQQISDIACLTRTSTCRFFKERTKKSIWEFLAEVRMNHAARLLRETGHTILSISQESGFKNISHFNRLFGEKFNCSPKVYRKQFAS